MSIKAYTFLFRLALLRFFSLSLTTDAALLMVNILFHSLYVDIFHKTQKAIVKSVGDMACLVPVLILPFWEMNALAGISMVICKYHQRCFLIKLFPSQSTQILSEPETKDNSCTRRKEIWRAKDRCADLVDT